MPKLALLAALFAPALLIGAERDLSKPINTICPVDGMAVDPQRDPIVISDTTGNRTDLVPVGVCTHETCAEAVRSRPEDYLTAARRDQVARSDRRRDDTAQREREAAHREREVSVTTDDNPGKSADPAKRALRTDRPNAIDLTGQGDQDRRRIGNDDGSRDREAGERR